MTKVAAGAQLRGPLLMIARRIATNIFKARQLSSKKHLSLSVKAGNTSSATHGADLIMREQLDWEDALKPRVYTKGQWLLNNRLQHESRFISFDVSALSQRALSFCSDAKEIVHCEKIEGGYNRTFVMTADTGQRVVARLPTQLAGPKSLITNSEVATMTYMRSATSIPIPQIFDWSDDDSNFVGSEYIIMECMPGAKLHDKWPSMDNEQRFECTQTLSKWLADMARLDFPAYGSIYFEGAIDPEIAITIGNGFCIGPFCNPLYWNCGPGEQQKNGVSKTFHGPWRTLEQYCAGLIDIGHVRLPKTNGSLMPPYPPYQGDLANHKRLLRESKTVISQLATLPLLRDASAPILAHADYHKGNIFVSAYNPNIITGVIDWQASSIEPAYEYTRAYPDFLFATEPLEITDREEERYEAKLTQKGAEICQKTFDVIMKASCPKIQAARNLKKPITRPFMYCYTSWRDSAPAVRQDLIELARKWSDLGLPGTCNYQPTDDELIQHQDQMEAFEAVLKVKDKFHGIGVDSDGWVQQDRWEAVLAVHKEYYDHLFEQMRSEDGDGDPEALEKFHLLWPFDKPSDIVSAVDGIVPDKG